jgi:LysM repeat protein
MKAFTLILFLNFTFVIFTHGASPEIFQDSAKYKWVNGNKFLLHKVLPKETWNSIARKYNLPVADLMKANTGVTDLKIAQILNIPTPSPVTTANVLKKEDITQPSHVDSKYKTAILYTVQPNETLFSIAKKFNSTIEDLKKWNNLLTDIVQEGQNLIVSYTYSYQKPGKEQDKKPTIEISGAKPVEHNSGKISEIKSSHVENKKPNEISVIKKDSASHISATEKPFAIKPNETPDSKKEIEENKVDINEHPTRSMIPVGKGAAGKTLIQITENGVCSWINDAEINQNKYYGLHRTAPIGTIIKVINKMNDRYVFVKVVGVLPDTGDNENSIIKISQAAVNKIGALDAHFQVDLSYGVLQ